MSEGLLLDLFVTGIYISAMHPSALAILAVAIPTLYFVQRSILDKFRKPKIPYFPGPKPLPIIGNLLDLPESKVWLKAKEWAVVHGEVLDMYYFSGRHTFF